MKYANNCLWKKSCFIYVLLESSIDLGCMALRLFLPQRCLAETFWIFSRWIFVTNKVDFLSVVQLFKCDIGIAQVKNVPGANIHVNHTRIAWITLILVRYGHSEMEIRERRVPEKTHFWNLWKRCSRPHRGLKSRIWPIYVCILTWLETGKSLRWVVYFWKLSRWFDMKCPLYIASPLPNGFWGRKDPFLEFMKNGVPNLMGTCNVPYNNLAKNSGHAGSVLGAFRMLSSCQNELYYSWDMNIFVFWWVSGAYPPL